MFAESFFVKFLLLIKFTILQKTKDENSRQRCKGKQIFLMSLCCTITEPQFFNPNGRAHFGIHTSYDKNRL